MIYTVRFWQYGQWNYIPDEPVDSIEETDEFVEKYGLGDYQVMIADTSNNKPCIWTVQKSIKFDG